MEIRPSTNGNTAVTDLGTSPAPPKACWRDRLGGIWPARRQLGRWSGRGRGLALATVAGVLLVGGVVLGLGGNDAAHRPAEAVGLAQVAANGIVEGGSRERPLVPETSGILGAVYVRVGQEVEAGALLFELRNEAQRAQVAVAAAELASAQAQAQQAQADYQRARKLLSGRSISEQDYDGVHYRQLTLQAKVREAEARLQLAEAELAKTQVRAPVAGQVLQIHKEPGVLVGPVPGQGGRVEAVLVLADVSQRRVRAFVEELDVSQVQVGQRAVVTADGFPGQVFAGRVIELAGRMGKEAPHSDAPGEYQDVYYREVLLELDGGQELPLNLRVDVKIAVER